MNEMFKNNLDENEWDYNDDFDIKEEEFECKKEKKLKMNKNRILNKIFMASKLLRTSDYKYIKNIPFKEIPKSKRCDLHDLNVPNNIINMVDDENGNKQPFTIELVEKLINKLKIEPKDLQLIFSDGSVKDSIGGAGLVMAQ